MTDDERRNDPSESTSGGEKGEESGVKRKSKKKRGAHRSAFLIFAALLVLTLALALRGRLRGDEGDTGALMTDFAYENGSDQTFAAAGNGLAVASASGVQLLNEKGDTVFREICSMDSPAVAASETRAVFYDVGGTTCIAADFSGESIHPETGGGIMSVSVSDSGYFTIISEETGSKGLVQVFSDEGRLLYKWYSGSGYPLKACLSPDDSRLAVLCVDGEGSRIHIFRLNSENELAAVEYDGLLLFDLRFSGQSSLCAIGGSGMCFFSISGEKSGDYDFGGRYLAGYDFGSDAFAAVYLSDYRAGTGGTLVTLSYGGEQLGSCEISGDLISLSACGKQLLTAASDGLALYSQSLERLAREETLITAKQAILRQKGDVLLLSLYSAERFEF